MTATLILESLAKEFSIEPTAVQAVIEMTDAGLSAPFIGRFRRAATGGLSESHIRRLVHARDTLEELDRRRGTIVRALEKVEGIGDDVLNPIRRCMDRFELEDLYVPHRRPEPEVQLALDRGLDALADLLVKPVPRSERRATEPSVGGETTPEVEESGGQDPETSPSEAAVAAPEPSMDQEAVEPAAGEAEASAGPDQESAATGDSEGTSDAQDSDAQDSDAQGSDAQGSDARASEDQTLEEVPSELPADAPAPEVDETAQEGAAEGGPRTEAGSRKSLETKPPATANVASLLARIEIPPDLARLCAPFVNPDKGIHTESEALAGALRILSDRLGRSSHLRTLIRRMMRKRGVLSVRPLVQDSKAGRHKALLKLRQPLRQIQGHRLLAIRQAQKERILNTVVHLDPELALPKVRAALGVHTQPAFDTLLNEIAMQALEVRLLPVVEADIRLELKEKGDQEALRFLSQHLRQLLLTPPLGRKRAAGVDINAKGDWTIAFLDEDGGCLAADRIETGDKDPAALGAELSTLLDQHGPMLMCAGHGKGPRSGVARMREALRAAGRQETVTVANEAGLSSYANSELARTELPETTVPQRMAISLGRRLQDPMAEILKVDPRHLSLGAEQGLVSKANAKRIFRETVESSVAHVGCDVNRAPKVVLERIPGLGAEAVKTLMEKRPFGNRDELRGDGLLDEAQWTSAIAFLRVPGSNERLDRTSLHPEQYALVHKIMEDAGATVDEHLGRPGVTKGLRRANYEVDEPTWRDLMRELSFPGRDPRPRLHLPEFMPPDTDPVRLTGDRVVSGVVTNVASFGAFVDLGLGQDAMLHISEIATRYVRDARELLSIGQTVRARIRESGGQRLALSLKDVPRPERQSGPPRGEGGGRRRRGRGGSRPASTGRGAIIGGGRRRGGGRGRGSGPRRGDGERMSREERADLDRLNAASSKETSYNPFAKFFKDKDGEEESS